MAGTLTPVVLLLLAALASSATVLDQDQDAHNIVAAASELRSGSGGGGAQPTVATAAGARQVLQQAMAAHQPEADKVSLHQRSIQHGGDAGAGSTGERCPQLSKGVLEARARRTGSGSVVMYAVVRPHVCCQRCLQAHDCYISLLLTARPGRACHPLDPPSAVPVPGIRCPPGLLAGQRAAVGLCPQLAAPHQGGGHRLLRRGGGGRLCFAPAGSAGRALL